MSDLANEKYISLTTFTKSGTPKPAPVWIADLGDDTIGFTTGSDSWKVKRIKNTPKVTIQPSNSKGVVTAGTSPVDGQARVVSGAEATTVQSAISKKYGVQYKMMRLAGKMTAMIGKGEMGNVGVIITLD